MPIYLPPLFEQTDARQVAGLIAEFPLSTIVTTGPDGLTANHIPLQFVPDAGEFGVLRGHVARANEIWRMADSNAESLAIFQSPDAYISPNWYPTKQDHHKVVPTWNYAVVHAYGKLVFHDDEKWLRGVIGKLTMTAEADQPQPWHMGQAPYEYLTEQLEAIVGIEMQVSRLVAKWKMSQNRLPIDRDGTISGLQEAGGETNAWVANAITRNTP
jgi:transcriptional regulator